MNHFYATLIRERFTLIPKGNSQEKQFAIGNRLDFKCSDKQGDKEASFIVRAQNIHTALRIGAHVARQWYEYQHINKTGRNRFHWNNIYKEATTDFEKIWNYECWASVYKNGKLLFNSEHEAVHKSEILDIIEQVHGYAGGNYNDIVKAAEKIFSQANRSVQIDYDCNVALDLHGSAHSVQTNLVYRDNDGRNAMDLHVKQKDLQYVRGAKGAYIKLSECLSLAALVFEGHQLGFVIGRTHHQLETGKIKIGHRNAVHADHAIRRLHKLTDALKEMKKKYQLVFDPWPDFNAHVERVEQSFKT